MAVCGYCTNPARYLVKGNRTRAEVCDDCLAPAQKAAGVPRSTELLDPMALPAAKAAGADAVQPALF